MKSLNEDVNRAINQSSSYFGSEDFVNKKKPQIIFDEAIVQISEDNNDNKNKDQ
jgi:hypothetical protein